jgi:hypothetical protein
VKSRSTKAIITGSRSASASIPGPVKKSPGRCSGSCFASGSLTGAAAPGFFGPLFTPVATQ